MSRFFNRWTSIVCSAQLLHHLHHLTSWSPGLPYSRRWAQVTPSFTCTLSTRTTVRQQLRRDILIQRAWPTISVHSGVTSNVHALADRSFNEALIAMINALSLDIKRCVCVRWDIIHDICYNRDTSFSRLRSIEIRSDSGLGLACTCHRIQLSGWWKQCHLAKHKTNCDRNTDSAHVTAVDTLTAHVPHLGVDCK